ncbi:MAG TPA: Rab family GTPase [Anaerolineales bacterium]|nr:Rab family GTPase [Anaerolineales bacterium]HVP21835.1 Rab family GTPase [Anaerolineaceae bacterium]
MPVIQKKICLLGDFAVGKTSLMRRFVEGCFDDKYLSTIGVKISRRTISRSSGEIKLIIWDLAGGDEFTAQSSYLHGVAGALIVCDLTRLDTMAAFQRYSAQVHQVNPNAPLVFLGNKVDLTDERKISDKNLQAASSAYGSPCFLSSAKTGEQVESAFLRLVEELEKVP